MSSQYARNTLHRFSGYVPGEQPQSGPVIKLNTNENPYPPAPDVLNLLRTVDSHILVKYPEPTCLNLRNRISEIWGISAEQVVVGNGSDDNLQMLFRAFVDPGNPVTFPYPTYSLYETLALMADAQPMVWQRTKEFEFPSELMPPPGKITLIANPNAPIGTLMPLSQIKSLCQSSSGLVVVDEAYGDFAPPNSSAICLLEECPNLIVIRTLSKSFSLAGIRLGYSISSLEIAQDLHQVRDSYNVNQLTQQIGLAALQNLQHMQQNVERIQTTRLWLIQALDELGFKVFPSHANFVFAQTTSHAAESLYLELKDRDIFVRYFNAPRLEQGLRITVGLPIECETLVEALSQIMAQ